MEHESNILNSNSFGQLMSLTGMLHQFLVCWGTHAKYSHFSEMALGVK